MADTGGTVVKPEDFLAFLKGYAPARRRGEKDIIAGRYRVLSGQPIAELSTSQAKAYSVRDEKSPDASLYALVYDYGVPLRLKNIQVLKNFRHPSTVALLADGMVEVSANKPHYAVVLERPGGQLLSQLLARRGDPVPESVLINQFLRPLIEIVAAYAKLGISHGRINPGNIYISGGNIVLGECVGEPSGYSQDYLFEPIERILASPRAKADFAPSADCYALGILALHLALGFAPFSQTNKEILIRDILNLGTYHALVIPWDLPPGLQDFFRGLLGEGRRDRWDAATLESWLGGRRFNLVTPTSPRDTSRGFEFEGTIHYNRRSLAYALGQHWKAAKSMLTDNRLGRWLKIHAHKPETADAVGRITAAGSERSPQQENEALSKIITLMDPNGPLRFKQISVAVEGIGALLAHSVVAERQDDIRALMQIIESDISSFWIEQQKPNNDYVTLTTKLQRGRQHIRMTGMGFGLERGMYDLNPGLPCLSPLIQGHHATNLEETLLALDAVSRDKVAEDLTEKHMAAFLSSRLELSREIKLHELQSLPRLTTHPTLIMLKLLALAQHKIPERSLPGLANWIALKLLPLLDGMHSKVRQRKLAVDLRAAANKGSLEAMCDLFLSPHSLQADMRDFQRATADYAARKRQIAAMQGTQGLIHHASIKGRSVAQRVAYGICITTIYVTLKSYFNI